MTHPPITDEMVERAAIAAWVAYTGVSWDRCKTKPKWREVARAALEAALSGKEE